MHMNYEEELHVMITKRANELSQHRKNGNGDEFGDWLRAEQEILQELNLHSDELFKEIDITSDDGVNPYLY